MSASMQAQVPFEERRRPWPAVNEDTEFFWEGVDRHELRIQSCPECGMLVHPPRPACANCGSLERSYVVASGKGRVYSHVTMHKPLAPPYAEPYAVVVVELDEGTRLVTQLVGIEHDEIVVDLPVRLALVEVEPGLTLPLFRPAEPANYTVEE